MPSYIFFPKVALGLEVPKAQEIVQYD
jgi:hypothetical protein